MFAIVLDSIDSGKCILSFWRQDNPLDWPPQRGGVHELCIDDLEYQVDEVTIEAEGAWSDQAASATLEFLMTRQLLRLPIYSWRKELLFRRSTPACARLHRDLEISRTNVRKTLASPLAGAIGLYAGEPCRSVGAPPAGDNPIDAVLSDSRWIGLVMDEPPSARPESRAAPESLTAALRAGLPVILWHPRAAPEDPRVLIDRLACGPGGVPDLPEQRRAAHLSSGADDLVRDLVVRWDDPNRTFVFDQPSSNPGRTVKGQDG